MTTPLIPQSDFNEITQLIHAARQRAVQAVNTALIELYWQQGSPDGMQWNPGLCGAVGISRISLRCIRATS